MNRLCRAFFIDECFVFYYLAEDKINEHIKCVLLRILIGIQHVIFYDHWEV